VGTACGLVPNFPAPLPEPVLTLPKPVVTLPELVEGAVLAETVGLISVVMMSSLVKRDPGRDAELRSEGPAL
jgi:hypothetical protein